MNGATNNRRLTHYLLPALAGLVLLALLWFVWTHRSTAPNESAGRTLQRVQQSGEWHVGYLVFDPCVTKDPTTGKLSGLFIDAVEHIADQLKVKPVYHETTLGNFAAGLQSGQYDLSIGPTYRMIPRATSVAFCRPLAYIGNAAVVRKGDQAKYDTLERIGSAKPRIAVLQGQAMEEFCRRRFPGLQIVSLSGSDLTAPLTAVSSGQADIGFRNFVTVRQYAAAHPEVAFVFAGEDQLELLALGWAVRLHDVQWRHFIDTSLDYLISTGRWNEFQEKYDIPLLQEMPVIRYPPKKKNGSGGK